MGAQNAVRIIEDMWGLFSRKYLLIQLQEMNEDIHQLIQKLQESAALSGLRLRQFYKHVEKDKEEYLLQMLDSRINSLQFYDIIIQKLDHVLRTHFLLIEDLKKGLQQQDSERDAASFLLIFPEVMQLHEGLLQLIKEEYSREINELERHFIKVSQDQIPKEAVDIQLEFYRKTIEQFLDQVMERTKEFTRLSEQEEDADLSKLKSTRFQHVLSLYTMNSEREVFKSKFSHRPFCALVAMDEDAPDEENDVELF